MKTKDIIVKVVMLRQFCFRAAQTTATAAVVLPTLGLKAKQQLSYSKEKVPNSS